MTFFSKKSNSGKTSMPNKRIFLQWTIPITLMAAVLIVVVCNSFAISKSDAKEVIYERLIMQSKKAAVEIKSNFDNAVAAAAAVGRVMEEPMLATENHLLRYAKEIKKAQPNCYLVVIADNDGQGFTSAGKVVNIEERDYFSISRSEHFCKTENDGITGGEAFVFSVPYYMNNISEGNVYIFIAPETVEEWLPVFDYDTNAAFGVCDSRGAYIDSFGKATAYFEGERYIENVQKSKMVDMTYAIFTMKLGKRVGYAFSTELKDEEKTIVSVPLGIGDWQYLTVLNQNYVDTLVDNVWDNVRELAWSLGVIAVIYVAVMVIISLYNRIILNQKNRELAHKADTDLLTDLNNKIATERKIQEYIDTHPDSQGLFFLFDIDNFKKINDTMGHAFGDEVLRTLGIQLRNEFRVTDIIGRTGGDEFILFLKDLNSDDLLEKEAKRLEDLFENFQAGEYVKYSATASIGATVYPRDAKDYQGLYKTADTALYEAKRRGKNCLVFYNKDLQAIDEEKKATPIESDMR